MVVEIYPLSVVMISTSKNVTFEYSYVNLIVGCCWLADLIKSFRSCSDWFQIRNISSVYLSQSEGNLTQLIELFFQNAQ